MNIFKRNPKLKEVDKAQLMDSQIKRILEQMAEIDDTNSEEYIMAMERLDKLVKTKETYEADKRAKKKLSPDSILTGAISIVELVLIMNFERLRVFTGKAFSHFVKPKM